jgi:rhomboid protease GluP
VGSRVSTAPLTSILDEAVNQQRFRVCNQCGRLIAVDARSCEYCQPFPVQEAAPPTEEDTRLHQFIEALRLRSSKFTFIFIGINVGLFLLMSLAGGIGSTSTDHDVLVGFGAKVNNLISRDHQYWRFVTSIFLHIGVLHLVFNNYALWIVGQEIERLYGSARFVLLYLATGIIGSLSSYYFNPGPVSAGASGAIFGLFGILVAFAVRYRKEIPDIIRRDITRRAIPVILINLAIGFSVKFIDNAAHLGGLLGGVLLAMVVPYQDARERSTSVIWRALQVVSLGIILISFVAAFRNYDGPPPRIGNLAVSPNDTSAYFAGMKAAHDSLRESIDKLAAIADSRDASADSTGPIEAVERGINTLDSMRRPRGEAEQYRQSLHDLLTEQRTIIQEHIQAKPKDWNALDNAEIALIRRNEQWVKSFQKWLDGSD